MGQVPSLQSDPHVLGLYDVLQNTPSSLLFTLYTVEGCLHLLDRRT